MDNVPLPSNRHTAATFSDGARVYDELTRGMGTVKATRFSHQLKPPAPGAAAVPGPSIFTVPDSEVQQVVTLDLDAGGEVVRLSTQLHDVGGIADTGRVILDRVKGNG